MRAGGVHSRGGGRCCNARHRGQKATAPLLHCNAWIAATPHPCTAAACPRGADTPAFGTCVSQIWGLHAAAAISQGVLNGTATLRKWSQLLSARLSSVCERRRP